MSLTSVRPRFAPEDCQRGHKQALQHSSRAPQKVLNLGHINGDLCPVLDAGTLRINADSRTASGATDSSHGNVLVEEEEVQSPITNPPQTSDKSEGTSATIKIQPRRIAVSQPAQGIRESSPSGCGLLQIMFSCLNVKGGAGKAKPSPKGGRSKKDGSRSPHAHTAASKSSGHRSAVRGRSRERHGRHGLESRSSSKIGVSHLGQTQSASPGGGESLRNRFTESPVQGPPLPKSRHRSSEGRRHGASPSVVSSATSEPQSQINAHNLDAHLARERRHEVRRLRERGGSSVSGSSRTGSTASSVTRTSSPGGSVVGSISSSNGARGARRGLQRSDSFNSLTSVTSLESLSSMSSMESMSSWGSHGSHGGLRRHHSGGSSSGSTSSGRSKRHSELLSLEGFAAGARRLDTQLGYGSRSALEKLSVMASAPAVVRQSAEFRSRAPVGCSEMSPPRRSRVPRSHDSDSFSPAAAAGSYASTTLGHGDSRPATAIRGGSGASIDGQGSRAKAGLHRTHSEEASPGQVSGSQMEQLYAKVLQQRADTESQLDQVKMAIQGGILAGMQVGGKTPAAFLNLPRFQDRRLKLLRRLDKLFMQQRRLEDHLERATEMAGPGGAASVTPRPSPGTQSSRTPSPSGGPNLRHIATSFASAPAHRGAAGASCDTPKSGGKRVTFAESAGASSRDGLAQANKALSLLEHIISEGPIANGDSKAHSDL